MAWANTAAAWPKSFHHLVSCRVVMVKKGGERGDAQTDSTLPPAPAGSPATARDHCPPHGWRSVGPPIPLVALLQVALAAMLRGHVSLTAIAQWVRARQADGVARVHGRRRPAEGADAAGERGEHRGGAAGPSRTAERAVRFIASAGVIKCPSIYRVCWLTNSMAASSTSSRPARRPASVGSTGRWGRMPIRWS